jgi:hypothetical protein
MKYLMKFNESDKYNQIFDCIEDCFIEFEDNGWKWLKDSNGTPISYQGEPSFRYIMKNQIDVIDDSPIEFIGSIDSNGIITWEREVYQRRRTKKNEEFQDFIVAIKRLQGETGLELKFSYNNLDYEVRGGKKIVIQGILK